MEKVLIVEDDVAFGTMLKTFLEKRNYEVSLAFSASEAFKYISSEIFGLILTDVRLPDHNGLEILKRVKAENPAARVIVMTSYAEISMAVEAMKAGAFDYVSKPFRPESILQTIENALKSPEVHEVDSQQSKKKTKKPATGIFIIIHKRGE